MKPKAPESKFRVLINGDPACRGIKPRPMLEVYTTAPKSRLPAAKRRFVISPELKCKILADHLFVEHILQGEPLLEEMSYLVFAHHSQGRIDIRSLRQRWRKDGLMCSSDENYFSRGCRWSLERKGRLLAVDTNPSLTLEEACRIISAGSKSIRKYSVVYSGWFRKAEADMKIVGA